MILLGEHAADDAARGRQREVGDLGADLLERAGGLGLDLLPRLLEPALAVGLRLLLRTRELRVGDLARLGEDLARLALRLADQRPVLLEQLARLGAGVVRLLDGLPDAIAPLVDRLLDRTEGVLRCSTKNVIANAISVQIIRPGTTSISAAWRR